MKTRRTPPVDWCPPWHLRLACAIGAHRWVWLPGFWPSCWTCGRDKPTPY